MLGLRRALLGTLVTTALVSVTTMALVACAPAATKSQKGDGGDTYEEDPTDPVLTPPRPPDYESDDSGAFDLGARKNNNPTDGGRVVEDAGHFEAGPDGSVIVPLCSGALAAGDVKIVEIMISSVAGQNDSGEWVELQSTRSCRLNIKGLTVGSPRGTVSTDSVTIGTDTILAPYGIFVVADSPDTTVNHGLPTPIFSWNAVDALKNDGDTINVSAGATAIDTLTYPRFSSLPAGRSISFPADCAWSDRDTWARWSYSFNTYSTLLQGTPNKDNTDVTCY